MSKLIIDMCKKNKILEKIIRYIYNTFNRLKYLFDTCFVSIDEKTILFSSFNGKNFCDSPKAIYTYMLNDKRFVGYKYIWVLNDKKKYHDILQNKNTFIVSNKGRRYNKALKKAKYWFLNHRIEDYIFPTNNQVYVQCWHGTPLKKLGCDLQHFDNAMNSLENMKKRYRLDTKKFSYFISPSHFASEKFISIWDMKSLNKETCIIEKGYPRNDLLFNYKKEDIQRIKKKLNIKTKKKIILYAPTYRDNQYKNGVGYTYKNAIDFDLLKEKLNQDYIVLFRCHWLVANNFNFEKYKNFIYNVSDYDDINELYIISDMLITDYSSVFFDYANLKKPIIFYMYDLNDYRDNIRGFYLDINELPGNIVTNETNLINNIANVDKMFYNEKYKEFNKKYNYLDDGKAASRVVDYIFAGGKYDEEN